MDDTNKFNTRNPAVKRIMQVICKLICRTYLAFEKAALNIKCSCACRRFEKFRKRLVER